MNATGKGLGIFQAGSNSEAIDDIIVKAGAHGISIEDIIENLRHRQTNKVSDNPIRRVGGHVKYYGIEVGIYEIVDGRVRTTNNAAEVAEKIKEVGILKYRDDIRLNRKKVW